MKQLVKYSLVAIVLIVTIAGLSETTILTSASVSGSFNPQTQFPVGSSIKITSVYGVAMVPLHLGPSGLNPSFNNQTTQHNLPSRNQTGPHGSANSTGPRPIWNQTGQHKRPSNQTGPQLPPWNQEGPRDSTVYSTSITMNAKVTNNSGNGDIEWTIQSGSIVVNGTTYKITIGNGRMNNIDRLMMFGNATDSSEHTIRWHLDGLAAMYNGTVIVELNGHSFNETNDPAPTSDKGLAGVNLTYIATIS